MPNLSRIPPPSPPKAWITSGALPPNEVAAYLAIPVLLVASQYASTNLQKVPGQVCVRGDDEGPRRVRTAE